MKKSPLPPENRHLYTATRDDEQMALVAVRNGSGIPRPLDPRLDLRNHSPTGLDWGYSGSGPSQLSLALLADHFGRAVEKPVADALAQVLYQSFKFSVVAGLPSAGWTLTDEDVSSMLLGISTADAAGFWAGVVGALERALHVEGGNPTGQPWGNPGSRQQIVALLVRCLPLPERAARRLVDSYFGKK